MKRFEIEVYSRRNLFGRKVWDFRIVSTRPGPTPASRIIASSRQGYANRQIAFATAFNLKEDLGEAPIRKMD